MGIGEKISSKEKRKIKEAKSPGAMALKLLNQAFSKREMAASTGKTLNPQKTEEIIGMYFV